MAGQPAPDSHPRDAGVGKPADLGVEVLSCHHLISGTPGPHMDLIESRDKPSKAGRVGPQSMDAPGLVPGRSLLQMAHTRVVY